MNSKLRFTRLFARRLGLITTSLISMASIAMTPMLAHAAGGASFSLSPSSGTITKSKTLNVSVYETSANHVVTVETDMTYDKAKFQYVSVDMAGSEFDLVIPQTQPNGNGSVKISAAKTGGVGFTGRHFIGKVIFKALAGSGSSSITFASSSAIVLSPAESYKNDWNGSPNGGTYGFSSGTTIKPPPSGGTKTPVPVGGTKTPTTIPTKKKSTTKTTTTTTTTPQSQSILYIVAIEVLDTHQKPVKQADVTLSGTTIKSGDQGIATFSNISAGDYTVSVKLGSKTTDNQISVIDTKTPGETQQFQVIVPVNKNSLGKIVVGLVIVLVLLGAIGLTLKRFTNRSRYTGFTPAGQSVVGGVSGTPETPTPGPINNEPPAPSGEVIHPTQEPTSPKNNNLPPS